MYTASPPYIIRGGSKRNKGNGGKKRRCKSKLK